MINNKSFLAEETSILNWAKLFSVSPSFLRCLLFLHEPFLHLHFLRSLLSLPPPPSNINLSQIHVLVGVLLSMEEVYMDVTVEHASQMKDWQTSTSKLWSKALKHTKPVADHVTTKFCRNCFVASSCCSGKASHLYAPNLC